MKKTIKSFSVRAAMMLLTTVLFALTAQTAWAAEWPAYITDVVLVGGTESEAQNAKSSYSGYTWCAQRMNEGSGADIIYIGYKTSTSANTNGGYITDFIIIDAGSGTEGHNPPSSLTFQGHTYYLCPAAGGNYFVNSNHGNLTSQAASGWNMYLYYTKENFSDKRAVSSIDITEGKDTQSGALNLYYKDGTLHEKEISLNRGVSGTPYVYMHISTETKVNRPYPVPTSPTNLTYNGSPKNLISTSYTNNNSGTVYYRVGNSGSYTTDVNSLTRTDAGQYYVWYYSGASDYGNSSKDYAHYKVVKIKKSPNSGATITCSNHFEGIATTPEISTNLSTGAITYKYSTSQNGTYTTTAPSTPGTYWVKATIASDNNCDEYTTAATSFNIIYDWRKHNSGDTEDDAYVISTIADLKYLAVWVNSGNDYAGKFFKLGGNIAFDKNTENNFTPIGTSTSTTSRPFKGIFDGQGYTISGLNINKPNNDYIGLFGYAEGATIKGVKLDASTITGHQYVGGILGGGNSSTTVENCLVTSDVTVSGTYIVVGGIVGLCATVRGCTSAAAVSGRQNVGGIIGHGDGSTVDHCLYTGSTVTATNPDYPQKGAIIGYKGSGTLTANYYTANGLGGCNGSDANGARKAVVINSASGVTVTPSGNATAHNVSGITGYDGNSGIKYTVGNSTVTYAGATESVSLDIAYNIEGFNLTGYTDGNGNALTHVSGNNYTLTMTANATTVTPVGSDVWGVTTDGRDGSAEHPYLITEPAGLDLLAKKVNGGTNYNGKYFELDADIAYSYDGLGEGESNYTPIGDNQHPFSGTFDGQGHTISGIRISDTNGFNKAIFDRVEGTVKNLIVSDCSMEALQNIGGIVRLLLGTIENCHVGSDVILTGNSSIGGIATDNHGGTIKGCTSAATIIGTEDSGLKAIYFGGIAGSSSYLRNTPTLTDNLFTGTISGELGEYIGAIVGENNSNAATLTNNYHTSSDMGGVGNENDGTDTGGATFAYEFPAANAAMGTVVSTYAAGTDYEGITVYQNGLAYNGKYYSQDPWGGRGTEGDPYVINNTAGLDKLASNVNGGNRYENTYFVLGADITYDESEDNNYTPIGDSSHSFYGTFDGQGHTISGINVNLPDNFVGLFGSCLDGYIKNLTVANSTFTGKLLVAAIAAFGAPTASVENCVVASDVTVSGNETVGGIAGEGMTVNGCISAATVSGTSYVGGIVGINGSSVGYNGGTVSNCLYLGTAVSGTGSYVGAIAGLNWTDATLANNYHTLSGMGGVGNENDATSSDEDGAFLAVSSTTKPSGFGEATTTYGKDDYIGITAYQYGLCYNGQYYEKDPSIVIWSGKGTAENPYVIRTTAELDLLASDVNSGNYYQNTYFVLGDDIVYAPDALTLDLDNNGSNDSNYMPVGNNDASFYGNFDGQGHTISGIRVNANEMSYIGVFGINDGTVKNLTVSGCLFAGNSKVGAIAGLNRGTVENCHVAADVSVTGNNGVGGIVGDNDGTTHRGFVLGCTSAAALSAKESAGFFGGIAGRNSGTLTDNLFTGTIDGMPDGSWGIGAITGYHNTDYGGTLTNNFHTCSGMGGVGNLNDATNSDEDGAFLAVSSTTKPGDLGEATTTYGKDDYIGITAYQYGLCYNGQYYEKDPSIVIWSGKGTAENPYVIRTTDELDLLASDVNGGNDYQDTYFVLGNDIVYAPDVLTLNLDNDGNNDSNYMPVGKNGSSFMGNFDGQGHTISGISVNANEMYRIGVFGINDGTVKNLTVSSCLFAGDGDVGAIAGMNRGTVENCHVATYVSITGNNSVGGVVGNNEGSVLGCTSAATLSAKESAGYLGGIAGSNTGTLTDNLFTGTIDKMPDGSWGIGAITGYHNTDYGGTLTNNFHTCSGMGGVGNKNDATSSDVAGAEFAVSNANKPDETIIGTAGTTYGTGSYIGITAYASGLYYNGKYYYHGNIKGDVNGNGAVDIDDAVSILRYLVSKPNVTFIEAAANVNGNGGIDIDDAVMILKFLVGKIDALSRAKAQDTDTDEYDPD